MADVIQQGIAQSVFTPGGQNGGFVTSIVLFFSEKDDVAPVYMELRPMVNGLPSSEEIFPNSVVTVLPAAVQTSADASLGTRFTFPEPIYLLPGFEYAFVVYSPSSAYKLYISEIGQFVLGSTTERIVKQPYLGSLFLSQNLNTWTPAQNKDLKFVAYAANFETQNQTYATFYNADVPVQLLSADPLEIESDGSTVTVTHPDHGFQVNDTVTLRGFDSDETLGGVSATSIIGDRTITEVDYTGYRFEADSASSFGEIGGGTSVTATRNILFDGYYPNIQTLIPNNTSVEFEAKFTTGKSFAGTETPYAKDAGFTNIRNKTRRQLDNPKVIANEDIELSELGSGVRSFDLRVNYSSNGIYVAPYVDMQTTALFTQRNIIDNQDSAASAGLNVPLNFVAETSPREGSAASKHVTRTITLAQPAVGLKIFLGANRPPASDFDVYYKTGLDETDLTTVNWTLVDKEVSLAPDDDPLIFRQYEYLIGGVGGTLPAFTKFKLKIVMRSTNQATVPRFRDLRAIALSV